MKTADRIRSASLAVLFALTGCVGTALPQQQPVPIAEMAPGCRVGPNGGPTQADPTIGGLADRGIGGTGAPTSVQTADRGIGGTGIIGVITGFASICLGGQEVAYGPALPILVDGHPATPADLRAGQLALIDATGPEAGLQARSVLIRHEVTGPVQSSFAADGMGSRLLRVAGQRVAVSAITLGDSAPPVGAWVAVSGFRDPDGVIRATRIDDQPPGETQPRSDAHIAGLLLAEGSHLRIGTAEIVPAPGTVLLPGSEVVVAGRWSDGILYVTAASPDLLTTAPATFFGPGVATLLIESYAGLNEGHLVLGRVQQRADGQPGRRTIVEFARRPDGALQPSPIREIGPGARGFDRAGAPRRAATATPLPRFEPAPMPQRGIDTGNRPAGRDARIGARVGARIDGRPADDRGRDGLRTGDPTAGGGFGAPAFGAPTFGAPAGGPASGSPGGGRNR